MVRAPQDCGVCQVRRRVERLTVSEHGHIVSAFSEIAAAALEEIDGVSLAPKPVGYQVLEMFGQNQHPGVIVTVDKNHQVSIEMRVYIRYGVNIPDAARQIQDVVRVAVERTTDINLREINVNVQGIERGKA